MGRGRKERLGNRKRKRKGNEEERGETRVKDREKKGERRMMRMRRMSTIWKANERGSKYVGRGVRRGKERVGKWKVERGKERVKE